MLKAETCKKKISPDASFKGSSKAFRRLNKSRFSTLDKSSREHMGWPLPYRAADAPGARYPGGHGSTDGLNFNLSTRARTYSEDRGCAHKSTERAPKAASKGRGPGAAARDTGGAPGAALDSVKVYFGNIRKLPLLTPREEKDLSRRVARGDMEARKKMIECNLRLVVNIAKRYLNKGLPLQDLIEEGNIGLIKSVERFRGSKGCRFSTYATYWIKQAVERAITNQAGVVRLPIHVTADMARLTRATREFITFLKREPSLEELSQKTGLSGRYIKKLNSIGKKFYSLDASLPDDADQSYLDRLEDEKSLTPMELIDDSRRSEKINTWLDMLDDNERTILKLRFGLDDDGPRTLEDIGRSFGVTRERVRQIEVKALGKLRKMMVQSEVASMDAI